MNGADRIVLADDHAPTLAGVRMSLEADGFIVVGEAANGPDAVALARRLVPDIVLLDVRMPGGGIEAARQIKLALPKVYVVMLSVSVGDEDLFEAVAAGVQGFLVKTMAADRLAAALRGVLAGEAALPRTLTTRLMSEFRSRAGREVFVPRYAPSALSAPLTEREHEVLDLMIDKLPTGAIADRLQISEVTVRRHISAIVRKSGAKDRRGAIELLTAEGESSVR